MKQSDLGNIINETGVELREDETPREYIHRVGEHAGLSEDILQRVSDEVERARFTPGKEHSIEEKDALEEFYEEISTTTFEGIDQEKKQTSDTTDPDKGDVPEAKSTADDTPVVNDIMAETDEQMNRTYSYRTSQRSLRDKFRTVTDWLPNLSRRQVRVAFLAIIILTVVPVVTTAATYDPPTDPQNPDAVTNIANESVTFFSVQGGQTGFGAGLYAMDTDTQDIIWSHTDYFRKYFDVDPLTRDEILFVAQVNTSGDSFRAIRMNWRTGEILTRFKVPRDTHDVDYIGNGTYAIADKTHDPEHGHRIYEYRPADDTVVWEYRFAEHFPPTAGDGIENDYTHLNDVDLVNNGSAYLTSPRNFDRVFLINRSTKEIIWQLGEEDNEKILDEQHNPTLLSSDPPVVLVGDSHNNRVVEYKQTDDGWVQTWEYDNWPWTGWARDADRLPNGNTIIVGSGRSRLLEVTPEKEIVWKIDISDWAQGPYDIERLEYGDEPQGPPINEETVSTVQTSDRQSTVFYEYYTLSQWVLPPWVSELLFVDLHILLVAIVGWGITELRWFRNE